MCLKKYLQIADKHGYGLAYYSSNLMGSNNPSMYGYLEKDGFHYMR